MAEYWHGEKVYYCNICKDNLFVPSKVENEYEWYKKCECYNRAIQHRKMENKKS